MIVLEKYKLIEEIAKGGMGLVYRAEDQKVGRIVAIKELVIPKQAKDHDKESLIERFKREAVVGLSLNHPNIVKFFDFGHENNRYFIAMEFLKGDNLKDFIINKHLEIEQLIQLFIQIAQGLEFAHNNKYKNEWKIQATGEGYHTDLEGFLKSIASEKIKIITN